MNDFPTTINLIVGLCSAGITAIVTLLVTKSLLPVYHLLKDSKLVKNLQKENAIQSREIKELKTQNSLLKEQIQQLERDLAHRKKILDQMLTKFVDAQEKIRKLEIEQEEIKEQLKRDRK